MFDRRALIASRYYSAEALFLLGIFWLPGLVFLVYNYASIFWKADEIFLQNLPSGFLIRSILEGLSQFFLFLATMTFAVWIWDLAWSFRLGRLEELRDDDVDQIVRRFQTSEDLKSLLSSVQVRCRYGDFSIGACVTGVFRPKVVISEGLLIGLVRGLDVARLVLSHEIAHVVCKDRLSLAFISTQYLGLPLLFVLVLLYIREIPPPAMIPGIVLSLFVTWYFNRRREFTADDVGASIFGDRAKYASLLERYGVHRRSFFHPALAARVEAFSKRRHPAAQPSGLTYLYLTSAALGLVGFLNEPFMGLVFFALMLMGGLGFLYEIGKYWVLGDRPRLV